MFYILNETGEVVRTALTELDTKSLRAAGYTVVESELNVDLDSVEVRGFPHRPVIVEKQPALSRIVLTTSVEDTDGDGLPELPADGKSKGNVRVFLHDAKGKILRTPVEVGFRVTAGAISQRSVMTNAGTATIHLTATYDTVTATVYAFAEGFEPGYLSFEFVPKHYAERLKEKVTR